jgi:hypothetical protein
MSKHTKMARAAVPPPQSRGVGPRLVPPGTAPVAVRQEIGEMDALKYRLAIQKDNNLKEKLKNIEGQKALLAKEEENIKLRIDLTRMENRRDIGHLDIGQGDQLADENGRFYILRAPRQGSLPTIKIPPKAGPTAPEPPAAPPAEVPPANPEGEEEEEGEEENGVTEGNGTEAPPEKE